MGRATPVEAKQALALVIYRLHAKGFKALRKVTSFARLASGSRICGTTFAGVHLSIHQVCRPQAIGTQGRLDGQGMSGLSRPLACALRSTVSQDPAHERCPIRSRRILISALGLWRLLDPYMRGAGAHVFFHQR